MVFEKLHTFIGKNIKHLVERPDESYVFRLHQNKVLYVRASIMKRATNVRCPLHTWQKRVQCSQLTGLLATQVARDKLAHLGQCIGKMTHSGKFRLTVGCLDLLAAYAKYKVLPLAPGLMQSALPEDANTLSLQPDAHLERTQSFSN